jgi:hypothetical protein
VTIPASSVYNEAGIPQLSVSTNVKYTHQGFKTAFRLMADDDKQGTALGEYAVKKLKLNRLAVIDDATAYGQGLADSFEAAVKASGGQVVKREHTNDKAVDFNTLLTSIKAAKLTQSFSRLRCAGWTDGEADEAPGHEYPIDGRRDHELHQVHRIGWAGIGRKYRLDAWAALESRPAERRLPPNTRRVTTRTSACTRLTSTTE